MLTAASAVASWLLTYALHSTLLLGLSLFAIRRLGLRRLALQQALLRTALLGGLATASLALSPPPLPDALRWTGGLDSRHSPLLAAASQEAASARPSPFRLPSGWVYGLVAVWLLGAGIATARFLDAARRLWSLLSDRRRLASEPLVESVAPLLVAMGLRRAVDLTASARITVPLAAGVLRPTVCIPERALVSLPLRQQVGLCAHELAHVARSDPAWNVVYRAVEAAFFFQPLNRWVAARLRAVAECAADDLAATACGEPLALAQSLVGVASWTTGEIEALPVAGALSMRSLLGKRVERLMHRTKENGPGAPLWALVFAGALLGIAPTLPAVSAAEPEVVHQPVGCVIEGRFFEIDAAIEPASAGVSAWARLYFGSSMSDHTEWYWVEMVYRDDRFVGRLPKPKAKASPVRYYIEARTEDARVLRTDRYSAVVVPGEEQCPQGARVAPLAGATNAVTVHKKVEP